MKIKKTHLNEVLLLCGKWTSGFGNIIFDYLNKCFIASIGGTAALLLAAYQSAEAVMRILFNLVGGVVSDRHERKRIAVVTDMLAGMVCLILVKLVQFDFYVLAVIIANAILEIIKAFNSPTYKALAREMIIKERIEKVNVVSTIGSQVIKIVGPLLSLLLYNWVGSKGALLINAATFFISATTEILLRPINDVERVSKKKHGFIGDLKSGLIYIVRQKEIFSVIILASIINFFLAGYNLLLPFSNTVYRHWHENSYSLIVSTEAIGGILGALICSKLTHAGKVSLQSLANCLLLSGVSLCAVVPLARLGSLYIVLLGYLVFTIGICIFNIKFMTYIQIETDAEYLGRVFSVVYTMAGMFMPLGAITFSQILNVENQGSYLWVGIGIIIISAIFWYFWRKRSIQQ